MTNEPEIIEHLKGKLSPEVILLGGSRAINEETPTSDWDLYLIGNYPSRQSHPEYFCGEHLDVEVRPRSDIPGDNLQIYYGPVSSLRVLMDSPDRLGQRIVQQTQIAYKRGPAKKTPGALDLDRGEMSRMIAKLASHASDYEACFTNLGFIHRMGIQFWFESRGLWSLPPHRALPVIRKEDSEFASLLAIVAGAFPIATKIDACVKIQGVVWSA